MRMTGWRRRFDEPIALSVGRELKTLGDASRYVAALPKTVQHRPEWRTAALMLMMAAEGDGPTMFAHIGMIRALHADRVEKPKGRRSRRRRQNGSSEGKDSRD